MQYQVETLKDKVNNMKKACSQSNEEIINEAIAKLPSIQKIAVKTCFDASKIKNDKSMRYTTNWIYECILLRIKSKKAYDQLRSKNVLKLPCSDTLYRYLRKLKTSFGFQNYTFEGMKIKSEAMPSGDRRG